MENDTTCIIRKNSEHLFTRKNKPLKGNSLAECLRSGLKNVVSDDLISLVAVS